MLVALLICCLFLQTHASAIFVLRWRGTVSSDIRNSSNWQENQSPFGSSVLDFRTMPPASGNPVSPSLATYPETTVGVPFFLDSLRIGSASYAPLVDLGNTAVDVILSGSNISEPVIAMHGGTLTSNARLFCPLAPGGQLVVDAGAGGQAILDGGAFGVFPSAVASMQDAQCALWVKSGELLLRGRTNLNTLNNFVVERHAKATFRNSQVFLEEATMATQMETGVWNITGNLTFSGSTGYLKNGVPFPATPLRINGNPINLQLPLLDLHLTSFAKATFVGGVVGGNILRINSADQLQAFVEVGGVLNTRFQRNSSSVANPIVVKALTTGVETIVIGPIFQTDPQVRFEITNSLVLELAPSSTTLQFDGAVTLGAQLRIRSSMRQTLKIESVIFTSGSIVLDDNVDLELGVGISHTVVPIFGFGSALTSNLLLGKTGNHQLGTSSIVWSAVTLQCYNCTILPAFGTWSSSDIIFRVPGVLAIDMTNYFEQNDFTLNRPIVVDDTLLLQGFSAFNMILSDVSIGTGATMTVDCNTIVGPLFQCSGLLSGSRTLRVNGLAGASSQLCNSIVGSLTLLVQSTVILPPANVSSIEVALASQVTTTGSFFADQSVTVLGDLIVNAPFRVGGNLGVGNKGTLTVKSQMSSEFFNFDPEATLILTPAAFPLKLGASPSQGGKRQAEPIGQVPLTTTIDLEGTFVANDTLIFEEMFSGMGSLYNLTATFVNLPTFGVASAARFWLERRVTQTVSRTYLMNDANCAPILGADPCATSPQPVTISSNTALTGDLSVLSVALTAPLTLGSGVSLTVADVATISGDLVFNDDANLNARNIVFNGQSTLRILVPGSPPIRATGTATFVNSLTILLNLTFAPSSRRRVTENTQVVQVASYTDLDPQSTKPQVMVSTEPLDPCEMLTTAVDMGSSGLTILADVTRDPSCDSSLSVGVIAGIAAGCSVLCMVVVAVICICWRRKEIERVSSNFAAKREEKAAVELERMHADYERGSEPVSAL